MKARQLISMALATATLATTGMAFADDHRRGHRDDGQRFERQVERHDYRHDNRFDNRYDHRIDNRFDDRFDNRRGDRRHVERHVERHVYHHGPRHVQRDVRIVHRDVRVVRHGPHWQRGYYVPQEYRQSRYVVRHHNPHLYAPPRGHHWIQVNGDFLLVAVATGLIAHAILNQ
jgi:Ni/Co efflux regulator RcnB